MRPTPEEVVQAHVYNALTPPNEVEAGASPSPPATLCARRWPRNPGDRFLSYDDFIMSLEAARSQLLRQQSAGGSTRPMSPSASTSWWKRR